MQQHLIILGYEVSKFIPYILVLVIGLFVLNFQFNFV